MYTYSEAATPCPVGDRTTHTDLFGTRLTDDSTNSVDLDIDTRDYNPSITLSTPSSRYTQPARVGSTGPLPSSPPGASGCQSVLYSPWCPGTPPRWLPKEEAPGSVRSEAAPLLPFGVAIGQGRWEVGRVRDVPTTYGIDTGSSSVMFRNATWSSPKSTNPWYTSCPSQPVSAQSALSGLSAKSNGSYQSYNSNIAYDAVDALDHISVSSSSQSQSHSRSGSMGLAIDFEPRYLDYPPAAPKMASRELMEDPLDVPDYSYDYDEFDFGYIPGYGGEMGSPPEGVYDAVWNGGEGLRSPWYASEDVSETSAFLLAGQAEEGILARERRVRAMNGLGGDAVMGLGLSLFG